MAVHTHDPFTYRDALRARGEMSGPRWIAAVTACDMVGADDVDHAQNEAEVEHRDRMIACGREDNPWSVGDAGTPGAWVA